VRAQEHAPGLEQRQQAGGAQLVHDRAFDLGQVQRHARVLQRGDQLHQHLQRAEIDAVDAAAYQHQMLQRWRPRHVLHQHLLEIGAVGERQVLVHAQQQQVRPGLQVLVALDVAEVLGAGQAPEHRQVRP
jgi:hypothetical protein